jgi:rubrerythrin
MSTKEELLGFLKRQIEIENEIVRSLNNSLSDIENPTVKGVLKGISLDSVKHAEMYASAITLLTKVSKALQQEHLDKQRDLVEKIGETLPKIENEKVKLLLEAILADEKRHHELLKKILEIIVHGETITEADWWDVMWKNVPFHGSPGG